MKPAKETFSLLRDAYQIIDGIPEENFNLETWFKEHTLKQRDAPDCQTIACALGWITQHPKFRDLGLNTHSEFPFTPTQRDSNLNRVYGGYMAASKLFDLDYDDAHSLFCPRNTDGKYDPEDFAGSDKQLWLARVRNFLALEG